MAHARRSTSSAASCADGSGSGRSCRPATSTFPACSRASAEPTRASRSASARASPPTCSTSWPPTSSTRPSACWPATLPDELAVERLSRRGGGRRLRPRPRAAGGRDVGVAELGRAPDRRAAPRLGHHLRRGRAVRRSRRSHFGLALESGDPFLLRSLAARGFATAILPRSLDRAGGAGRRGAQPAPRHSPARGAGLAPRAQRAARRTHVHRVRPAGDGRLLASAGPPLGICPACGSGRPSGSFAPRALVG